MKKRKFPLIPALGICLVLIGLFAMIAFQVCMYMGTQQCHRIVSILDEILPERTAGAIGMYPDSGMPVLEIEGVDYVVVLEIPSFGSTLPVVDKWDSNKLFLSPRRFSGSAYDSTLVIGGADYPQQFGFCDKIEHGAIVTVTDMTGTQYTYTVSNVERANHAKTQWLVDEDYDLTLFCHDIYSMEYIAVRCDLAYN